VREGGVQRGGTLWPSVLVFLSWCWWWAGWGSRALWLSISFLVGANAAPRAAGWTRGLSGWAHRQQRCSGDGLASNARPWRCLCADPMIPACCAAECQSARHGQWRGARRCSRRRQPRKLPTGVFVYRVSAVAAPHRPPFAPWNGCFRRRFSGAEDDRRLSLHGHWYMQGHSSRTTMCGRQIQCTGRFAWPSRVTEKALRRRSRRQRNVQMRSASGSGEGSAGPWAGRNPWADRQRTYDNTYSGSAAADRKGVGLAPSLFHPWRSTLAQCVARLSWIRWQQAGHHALQTPGCSRHVERRPTMCWLWQRAAESPASEMARGVSDVLRTLIGRSWPAVFAVPSLWLWSRPPPVGTGRGLAASCFDAYSTVEILIEAFSRAAAARCLDLVSIALRREYKRAAPLSARPLVPHGSTPPPISPPSTGPYLLCHHPPFPRCPSPCWSFSPRSLVPPPWVSSSSTLKPSSRLPLQGRRLYVDDSVACLDGIVVTPRAPLARCLLCRGGSGCGLKAIDVRQRWRWAGVMTCYQTSHWLVYLFWRSRSWWSLIFRPAWVGGGVAGGILAVFLTTRITGCRGLLRHLVWALPGGKLHAVSVGLVRVVLSSSLFRVLRIRVTNPPPGLERRRPLTFPSGSQSRFPLHPALNLFTHHSRCSMLSGPGPLSCFVWRYALLLLCWMVRWSRLILGLCT